MPAIPAGLIAERRLVNRLMRADAVSPANAQRLEGLPFLQSRRLRRLLANGVIREEQQGNYYINIPAWVDHQTSRRRRAAFIIMAILIVFALSTLMVRL